MDHLGGKKNGPLRRKEEQGGVIYTSSVLLSKYLKQVWNNIKL